MRCNIGFLAPALGSLVLGATALQAQSARPAAGLVSRPASFAPLTDAAAFSGTAVVLDFEDHAAGTPITDQYSALGAVFGLDDGGAPSIWADATSPRTAAPAGELALTNGPVTVTPAAAPGARSVRQAPAFASAAPTPRGALGIAFGQRVNRVGFDLRGSGGRPLNLLLTGYRDGRAIATQFFDVAPGFGFVGVESTLDFDTLELATTNPAGEAYSLDNLRFELDLADQDLDGVPDFGDLCPTLWDPHQLDRDGDGIGDACDAFPLDAHNDEDGDGLAANFDNCRQSYNPDQGDADGDGIGDACDPLPLGLDSDGDGIEDSLDNCPTTPNPGQEDCDGDGIGDICDLDLVDPSVVNVELQPGECIEVFKSICLPAVPPVVDVLITVDTTGSMGGEITLLRNTITDFIQDLRVLTGSNLRFALARYRDYPSFYTSCGYSNLYGHPGDIPWLLLEPIGATDAEMLAAVNTLAADGGADGPESYTRVLWEVTQPDAGIGWRAGAQRVVIDFQDDIPHDCNVGQSLFPCMGNMSTGIDPGRDELLFTPDDLDLHLDSLLSIINTNTKLFAIHSGTRSCVWQAFAAITQGVALQINSNGTLPPGLDLGQEVFETITDKTVFAVTFLVEDPQCAPAFSFVPPSIGPVDVTNGALVTVNETFCVPLDTLPGFYSCVMTVLADGVATAFQTVNVTVGGCQTLSFEGAFPNGYKVNPGDFTGVTITTAGVNNYGAALFDSTPGGPNAFSSDPDLLVDSGNILILQENQQQSSPGVFANPDDAQLGGRILFTFDEPVEPRSIDLVDIDASPPSQTVEVVLLDGSGRARAFFVPDGWTSDVFANGPPGMGTLDLTDLSPQPGYVSAATGSEDPGFDPLDVVSVEVHLSSSGAVDNLVWCPVD